MDDSNSNKSVAEEGGSMERERTAATMVTGMVRIEILDCLICREPLRPEIFQCSCGHFICKKCHLKFPKKLCESCSKPFSQRAYGMERVLGNIVFPCKYECGMMASSWYESKQHEEDCVNEPSYCPAYGCHVEAPKPALLDHISAVHKWPTTSFTYGVQFDLPALPGYRLLRGEGDDVNIFVLIVLDSLNNGQNSVYIEPVGFCDCDYDFGCSVSVTLGDSCGTKQHRSGSCDDITEMGPEDCLCIFPGRSDLVLKTTMSKKAL